METNLNLCYLESRMVVKRLSIKDIVLLVFMLCSSFTEGICVFCLEFELIKEREFIEIVQNFSQYQYDTRLIIESKSMEKIKNQHIEEIWKEDLELESQFASSSFKPKLLHPHIVDLSLANAFKPLR